MGATRLADEHRIGLKPLLRRVWAPRGQRPLARVRHRFAWRSLALPGAPWWALSIRPRAAPSSTWRPASPLRSSRSSWPRLPAPSGLARARRSCWCSTGRGGTPRVCACRCPRVPEHVHLLFLPPYSPELQPAEHLLGSAAADQHGPAQPSVRHQRGARGHPVRPLLRIAAPA